MNKPKSIITLSLIILLSTTLCSAKNVAFIQKTNKIDVTVDGKLFTSYLHAIDPAEPMFRKNCVLAKPVLFPVHSPTGRMITRGYPFIDIKAEAQDHPHHMGIYFTIDINNQHFWGNSRDSLPAIKHIKTTRIKPGQGKGTLSTISRWIGSDGKPMLEETRTMVFIAPENADYYAIDFTINLKALAKNVVFGDTKEGMMAIRVAPWLKEDKGGQGRYLSSEGKETEKNVWGRRAKWMRLQGETQGKTYGVTILNHPESTNYPTYWHARGYGCFTANPLGQGAFQRSHKVDGAKNLDLTLAPGETACFKHRMIIYEGPRTKDQIDAEFDDYAGDGYQLAYSQTFDNSASINDFEFTNPEKWQFNAKGNGSGSLEFLGPGNYKPKVRSPRVIGLVSDRMFGDFILEFDACQTGKEYGHRDTCIFYNFQDPSHFYYTHIASAADPHAHNIFIVNDKPRTAIATKTTKGIDWGAKNQWHKVRIERKLAEGTIKVFYDDMNTPIMTATDKTFGEGYIGFGTFDDSGKIDNIRIYAPQITAKKSKFFQKK